MEELKKLNAEDQKAPEPEFIPQPKRKKWYKRKWLWVVLGVVLVIGAFAATRKPPEGPEPDTVTLERRNVSQEVSVTGRVIPSEEVELAFVQTGKLIFIPVAIGDAVEIGDVVAQMDASNVSAQLEQARASYDSAAAQLSQYEAALEMQQVKLNQLLAGSRDEEIAVKELAVAQAEQALANAKASYDVIVLQADSNLKNISDDTPSILTDAFLDADDALRNKVDDLFNDSATGPPQISFTTNNFSAELDAENKRRDALLALDRLEDIATSVPSDDAGRDTSMTDARTELVIIKASLDRLLDVVNSAVGISQTTIDSYQTNVNTARANVSAAMDSIDTQKQALLAQQVANTKSLSDANATVQSAERSLASAEADLALAKAGTRDEEVAAQEAQVKQAEANLAAQRATVRQASATVQQRLTELDRYTLRAPISGIVTAVNYEVGEIATANSAAATVISSVDFEIEAHVPEADVAKIATGYQARVTLDSYGRDVLFAATVASIDPAETLIEGVATYRTTLLFTENDERIKSGMTANVDVYGESREDVLAVPQRAIIRQNGDQYVRVLRGEDTEDVQITTGLRGSDGYVEVMGNIAEGDVILRSFEE